MLTIWIHLDTGDVRKANVPEDYSTGDLLADILRSSHPGSPRMEWGMYDEVPEKVLSMGKTLTQNQVKHDAHLHLFSRVNLALEVDAPGFSATRREVSPTTLTGVLLADLVRHYELAGLPGDWQLVQSSSLRVLDPAKTLSANGVHSGEWLSIKPVRSFVDPLPPKVIALSLTEPKSGKTAHRTLSGSTVLSALLNDAVETLGLPRTTRTGKAQRWIFVAANSRNALDLDRTVDANGIKDGAVLQLETSVAEPELVLKMIAPGGAVKEVEAEAALGAEHLLRKALGAFALPEVQHGKPKRYRLQDKSRGDKDLNLAQTLGENGVADGASLQLLPVVFPWWIVAIAGGVIVGLALLGSLVSYLLRPKVIVTLASSRTALTASQTVQCNARVLNAKDPTVLWSLSPRVGEITSDGTYTAPGSLAGMVLVRVTAISRENTGKSASIDLTVSPAPVVVTQADTPPQPQHTGTTPLPLRVVPAAANISAGQSRRFVVTPDPGGPVQWGISPATGKIGPDGVYTAPAAVAQAATVTLTALLASGGSAGSAVIHLKPPATVAPPPVDATINGVQATKGENGQTVFHAFGQGGKTVPANWSVSPEIGTISAEGVYTPPGRLETGREVVVRATSPTNPGNVSSYPLRLTATYPTGISVMVSPEEHAVLRPGDRRSFTATVRGTGNTIVTWSAMGGGNILPNGVYVAPPNVPPGGSNVRIRATSNANPAVYGEAEVVLRPNVLANVPRGGSFQWQGKLKKNATLTIHNSIPSTGSLSGSLPAGPVEVHLLAGDCDITIAPSSANNWSVIAVKAKSNQTSLSFGWTPLSTAK